MRELPRHASGIGAIALGPDGKTIAFADGNQTIKLWDIATGEELLTLGRLFGQVWYLQFSPDGRSLALCTAAGPGPRGPNRFVIWRVGETEPETAAPDDGQSTSQVLPNS